MSNAEKNTPKTIKEWSNKIESQVSERELFNALKKAVDYGWISKEVDTFTYMKNIDRMTSLLQTHTNQTLQELKEKVDEKAVEIENAIRDQKEENLPVPDWLKGQIHAYLNTLQLIDEAINDQDTR